MTAIGMAGLDFAIAALVNVRDLRQGLIIAAIGTVGLGLIKLLVG